MTWQRILAGIALLLVISALLAFAGVIGADPIVLVIISLLLVCIILIA